MRVECRFAYNTLSCCQVLAWKMLGVCFPVLEGTLKRDITKFTAILRCHYPNLPSQRVNSWVGCSVIWERRRERFWRWLHCWHVTCGWDRLPWVGQRQLSVGLPHWLQPSDGTWYYHHDTGHWLRYWKT